VSRHRQLADSGCSSGLSKDELARQMSHSTSTAEGHYAMRDTVKGIRRWLAAALPFEIIGCQAL
jgi:predicted site-specific integrase-resolvase